MSLNLGFICDEGRIVRRNQSHPSVGTYETGVSIPAKNRTVYFLVRCVFTWFNLKQPSEIRGILMRTLQKWLNCAPVKVEEWRHVCYVVTQASLGRSPKKIDRNFAGWSLIAQLFSNKLRRYRGRRLVWGMICFGWEVCTVSDLNQSHDLFWMGGLYCEWFKSVSWFVLDGRSVLWVI
jgi:hypothetical protein